MKIFYSPKCLKYWQEGHVESPVRIKNTVKRIKNNFKFIKSEQCRDSDLLFAHSEELIKSIKSEMFIARDTPALPNIYEYAKLAAGGAVLAAEIKGFSLMRPPGHHTGRNGLALGVRTQGFCYLNNVAIAVKYLGKPALILDIDGHHGNGTQEIFLGQENVSYVGLHRYPHYPGTGYTSEANCLNFPLRANCGEKVYLRQ